MLSSLEILAGAAFTLTTCGALGSATLAWLRIRCSRGEAWALSLLTGAALFSTAILGLGLAGGLSRPALLILSLAALACPWFAPALIVGRQSRSTLTAIVTAAYAVVYGIHAWAPEISPDGMAYHVALPAQYLRDGRIGFIPTNIYAQLSQAMEMLFLDAFAFGRHSAAALVHLAFLFALLALMRTYALRAGIPRSAGLLVLASPIVGIDAASAYNDVAVAAVIFAVFWTMERWREEECDRLLWVAGLMAGLAFAMKYTAFLALPYALVSLGRRITPQRAGRLALAAALVMGPWLLKNWVFTGNPVAPFANSWFPNDVFDPELEHSYRTSLGFLPETNLARLPQDLFSGGFAFGGLLGPVFWLSPLLLFSRWRLVLPALLFAAPFAANASTRFLIPGLPFVALGMALVLGRARGLWPAVALVHVVLGWYPVTHAFADPYAWYIKEVPWRAALRLEPEGSYIGSRVTDYPMFETLQGIHGPVLTYSQYSASYAGGEMITGTLSRRGTEMREMLWTAALRTHLPREGTQFWFPQQRLSGVRVSERERSAPTLMVGEIRLYHLLDELSLPGARASTSPGSIEAPRVLDGNPLTRWRGDQDARRRASLTVTWKRPALLSRVVLEGTPPVPLRLEGLGEDGLWRELPVKEDRTWFEAGDLRHAATRALRQQGVRWLLLNRADFGRAEMEQSPAEWGLRMARRSGSQTLFELLDP